ncbi:MAG: rod shape-determining protein MreC [Candidatus Aureabacteria bacterium]|nr:rod shape-determining protein MreC [Candidatus Auribacterota bacterium]
MLWRKRAFVLLIILTLFFILAFSPFSGSVKNFCVNLVHPFLNVTESIKSNLSSLSDFTKVRSIIAENKRLKEENDLLKISILESREAAIENTQLRKLLEFKKRVPFQTIPAEVVGRDISNWNKTILINKGSKAGIRGNMVVVSGAGLVGNIIEVYEDVSRVLLINDVKSKCSAMIQETRDMGMISGDGAGGLKMSYISRNSEVEKDNIVVTSGMGGIYQKGLLIGSIISVYMEEDELNKFAKIRPEVDFNKIENVLVIIEK